MIKFEKEELLLIRHVEGLDEENVLKLSKKLLNDGMDPLRLLELVNNGTNLVGKLYERKEYYIADLLMAGIIFKQVLELVKITYPPQQELYKQIGKVVIGTAKGDIHDIGKDIFRGMLVSKRFEVIDLGVDVSKELFVKKVIEEEPDILGISGIMTQTLDAIKEVVDALIQVDKRDEVKIIIGGNHLSEEVCKLVGADSFARDASIGIKKCLDWINY